MNHSHPAPKSLSAAGKRIWAGLMVDYDAWDRGSLVRLEAGLQARDRWLEAKAALDLDGLTTLDRFGQLRPHPAAGIERDSRAAMVRAFKELNLDIEEQPTASELGTRAAQARWHRRGA